jgi:hypothetical protein
VMLDLILMAAIDRITNRRIEFTDQGRPAKKGNYENKSFPFSCPIACWLCCSTI